MKHFSKHPEVNLAAPKLRSNVLVERWPRERREQILDWIGQGLSLRHVSTKIRKEYGISIHHTTLGRFYARERKRSLEEQCIETSRFYETLATRQKECTSNIGDSLDFLLRMEFMRYYNSQQLSPAQFLQFFRAFLKQQKPVVKKVEPTLGPGLFADNFAHLNFGFPKPNLGPKA